ncbi:MAG TPA: glutaredoxin 3 [Rheinheimera sp.]|nr:glutaredoxin 3 [Rheinheimera sp.]
MSKASITIYTKVYCPYCVRAKALLTQKGVSFTEFRIDEQPELRPEMIEKAQGRTTVPQIFINGQHIGGCDDLYALDAQGKLDPLLQ